VCPFRLHANRLLPTISLIVRMAYHFWIKINIATKKKTIVRASLVELFLL
jgi:hypothetical protein